MALSPDDLARDRAATWRVIGVDPEEAERTDCWLAPSVLSALRQEARDTLAQALDHVTDPLTHALGELLLAIEKHAGIMKDPHPGLSTWHEAAERTARGIELAYVKWADLAWPRSESTNNEERDRQRDVVRDLLRRSIGHARAHGVFVEDFKNMLVEELPGKARCETCSGGACAGRADAPELCGCRCHRHSETI